MKKFYILTVLLMIFILSGCNSITNNEIYNKSINSNISIEEFEDLIVAAVEKTSPAVVGVSNYQKENLNVKLAGTGSGVVYSCSASMKDGSTVSNCETTINSNDVSKYKYLVVTNRHVIEDSDIIKVYLGEERTKVTANLIQFDDKVDLAVVSFEHTKYIQPLSFADSDQLKRGSFAIAIGNPSGYDFYGSSTFGIISYPKRYLSDDTDGDDRPDWDAEYIQHDVAINPGNSGGALINTKGELIGINTLKFLSDEIDNMGFAIPSNVVKNIVKILETGSKPTRRVLGISIIDVNVILNPEDYPDNPNQNEYVIPSGITHGLYVASVEVNKPAYKKLQMGDIILKINGIDVYYSYTFREQLNSVDTANITVYRNNQQVLVTIQF